MNDLSVGVSREPRIGEPETSAPGGTSGGSIAGAGKAKGGLSSFLAPNLPDTSGPGPTALQEPAAWAYDFNPASGSSRATFNGEVSFASGGPTTPVVVSFNTRTGAVVLTQADVSAVAVGSFNTRVGAVTLTTADVSGAGGALASQLANYLALTGGTLTGPLTPAGIVGAAGGTNAAAGQVGEVATLNAPGSSIGNGAIFSLGALALPAGDWDVSGFVAFATTATTSSAFQGGFSTSATAFATYQMASIFCGGANLGSSNLALPTQRINVAATTNIFLNALSNFTSGTVTANGQIYARRAR
jgi:hypothetical protein